METASSVDTEARKVRHLDICLNDDVRSKLDPGWSAIHLTHEALPEMALVDVDISTTLVGYALRAPLVISSMTGGTERASAINRTLAEGASDAGLIFGLGSGRAMIENPELRSSYDVRDVAPNAILFANIGAVQLNYGVTIDNVRRMLDDLRADGIYLHLNPLQEALQPGGDTNFRGIGAKIAELCAALDAPVIAKGVGSGISVATASRLIDCGIAAIEIAGAGGTSWARVEGKRSGDEGRERIAETFGAWGYPTAYATAMLRDAFPDYPLIASGGIRSGIEMAKALAIGADACGVALPFLEAASESLEAVRALIDEYLTGLRIAMFAAGAPTLDALRDTVVDG